MAEKIKINWDNIVKWANILFLFLFGVHLFDFPDKYIIVWTMMVMILFWLKNRTLCLDKIFWILSLAIILNGLGTYYYLGGDLSYTYKNIVKMVVPTIMIYPFMKQIAWKKNDADIEKTLLAIALGTCVYSLLNYYMLAKYDFYQGEYRGWADFWTKYNWRATHYSYWGCFVAGLGGYAIYCIGQKKWFKGFLIGILILIENYIQIQGDNRMVLCVTAVSMAVTVAMFCYLNAKNKKAIIKGLLIVSISICVAVFLINNNFMGIQDTGYYQRFITRNGGILKNSRFRMIYEAIILLPSHWKGGATMWAGGNYWVHNYWLQVANVSGILPFVLWMIVNLATVVDVIKVLKSPNVSNKIKYMFLPMLASVVSYLMMEPGGTELNRYIIFYVMLIALLKQLAHKDESLE